jgi:hypothetical protein
LIFSRHFVPGRFNPSGINAYCHLSSLRAEDANQTVPKFFVIFEIFCVAPRSDGPIRNLLQVEEVALAQVQETKRNWLPVNRRRSRNYLLLAQRVGFHGYEHSIAGRKTRSCDCQLRCKLKIAVRLRVASRPDLAFTAHRPQSVALWSRRRGDDSLLQVRCWAEAAAILQG